VLKRPNPRACALETTASFLALPVPYDPGPREDTRGREALETRIDPNPKAQIPCVYTPHFNFNESQSFMKTIPNSRNQCDACFQPRKTIGIRVLAYTKRVWWRADLISYMLGRSCLELTEKLIRLNEKQVNNPSVYNCPFSNYIFSRSIQFNYSSLFTRVFIDELQYINTEVQPRTQALISTSFRW
jgi:hypothetical protein